MEESGEKPVCLPGYYSHCLLVVIGRLCAQESFYSSSNIRKMSERSDAFEGFNFNKLN